MEGKHYHRKPFFMIFISKSKNYPKSKVCNPVKINVVSAKYQNKYRDVWLYCSENARHVYDVSNNVIVLLYGALYDIDGSEIEYIKNSYLKEGTDFIRNINGSYALIIMDLSHDRFFIVTDRINSRKIFQYSDSDFYLFSNSIYSFKDFKLSPDPKGIAWYLSNGAIYNGRTLFQEICVLERATVTEISSDEISAEIYWHYTFNSEYENIPAKDLEVELNELLIKSIQRRIKKRDKIYVSLSGGYDSAAILGILKYSLKVDDVITITYGYGDIKKKSDVHVAKLMAEDCGYEFKYVSVFNDDLLKFLKENACLGQGTANICDEISAIDDVMDELGNSPDNNIFFGDECFGWVDEPLSSKSDSFKALRVYDFENMTLLKKNLSPAFFSHLQNELTSDYADVLNRVPDFEDYYDTKNYFYLDQRISHVMTSWRDFFYSPYIRIQNPFLDNEILEFMKKIPKIHRINKSLFKSTVTKNYPEIFKFKRAVASQAIPKSLSTSLLHQNIPLLKNLLKGNNVLDQYVLPDAIKKIMNYKETVIDTYSNYAQNIIRKVSRRSACLKKAFSIPGSTLENLDKTTLLKRIFVLRIFFDAYYKCISKC